MVSRLFFLCFWYFVLGWFLTAWCLLCDREIRTLLLLFSRFCILRCVLGFNLDEFVHIVSHTELILRELLRVTDLLHSRGVWLALQAAFRQVVSFLWLLIWLWVQFAAFLALHVRVERYLLLCIVRSSILEGRLSFYLVWVCLERLLFFVWMIQSSH